MLKSFPIIILCSENTVFWVNITECRYDWGDILNPFWSCGSATSHDFQTAVSPGNKWLFVCKRLIFINIHKQRIDVWSWEGKQKWTEQFTFYFCPKGKRELLWLLIDIECHEKLSSDPSQLRHIDNDCKREGQNNVSVYNLIFLCLCVCVFLNLLSWTHLSLGLTQAGPRWVFKLKQKMQ